MTAEADELYSLLVPLVEERLIVPRTCVAEVVRYSPPEQEAGAHNWMLGTVNWNGRALPVVSFEGTLGKDVPAATGRTRIVVFVASTGQLKTGYFGALTQGFPTARARSTGMCAATRFDRGLARKTHLCFVA